MISFLYSTLHLAQVVLENTKHSILSIVDFIDLVYVSKLKLGLKYTPSVSLFFPGDGTD